MTALPVILRELRAEGRRPSNYYLRLIGAACATLCFALLMLDQQQGRSRALGSDLFYALNAVQFGVIALAVPILTADCISRERREGTLGLLFLTPLTPMGVVMGKSVIQAVRGVSLFAAMVPVLALPHLLGGVGYRDIAMATMVNVSVLLLALGAGILASAFSRDWARAIVLALALSGFAVACFMSINWIAFAMLNFIHTGAGRRFTPGAPAFPPFDWAWSQWQSLPNFARFRGMLSLATGYEMSSSWGFGFEAKWDRIWAVTPAKAVAQWFAFMGWLTAACGLALMLALAGAAARIRASWRETPPSRMTQWTYSTFCTPRFWKRLFRGKLRRTLDRNPIGWLHQFSVTARLTKWGWCLVVLLAECSLVLDPTFEGLVAGQYGLALALIGALAFNASSSFQQERENGAFELLLVTPLRERDIILGRLRGVWAQFLPSIGVLLFVFSSLVSKLGGWMSSYGEELPLCFIPGLMITAAAVPIIGLRVSMMSTTRWMDWLPFQRDKRAPNPSNVPQAEDSGGGRERNALANWSVCCLLAVGIPYSIGLAWTAAQPARHGAIRLNTVVAVASIAQCVLAADALRRLQRSLRAREFILR